MNTWTCVKCGYNWECDAFPGTACPECSKQAPPTNILDEARDIISGPRCTAYGPVEESFERVARVWTELLGGKLKESLSSPDVALLMAAFKLCREANKASAENRVDAIGYMALKDQLHAKGATP